MPRIMTEWYKNVVIMFFKSNSIFHIEFSEFEERTCYGYAKFQIVVNLMKKALNSIYCIHIL